MEHIMHLHNDPFKAIAEGRKSIEVRLNDEKRRSMNVGDEVTFINRKTDERIKCKITNLYTYDNFEELYKHFDKSLLGYNQDEIADRDVQEAERCKKHVQSVHEVVLGC